MWKCEQGIFIVGLNEREKRKGFVVCVCVFINYCFR